MLNVDDQGIWVRYCGGEPPKGANCVWMCVLNDPDRCLQRNVHSARTPRRSPTSSWRAEIRRRRAFSAISVAGTIVFLPPPLPPPTCRPYSPGSYPVRPLWAFVTTLCVTQSSPLPAAPAATSFVASRFATNAKWF